MTPDLETIETWLKAAPDVEALKEIVATIGTLPGSRGRIHTARELIEKIDAAVQVPALANRITRTLGLRDKVREISGRDATKARHAIQDAAGRTIRPVQPRP